MLSYVIPVEEKSSSVGNKAHLQLDIGLDKEQNLPRNSDLNCGFNGLHKKHKMAPTAIHNFINIEQSHGGIVNGGYKKVKKTQGKVTGPSISTESSASSLSSKASDGASAASQTGTATTPTSAEKLKPKLVQNGAAKSTSLKR